MGREVGREDEGVTPSSLPAVNELELTLTGLLAREGELPASRKEVFPPGEVTRLKGAARKGRDLLPLPLAMDVSGELPSTVCMVPLLLSRNSSSLSAAPAAAVSPDRSSLRLKPLFL